MVLPVLNYNYLDGAGTLCRGTVLVFTRLSFQNIP